MINVFQPSLGAEELAAIEKVFQSNWLGKGDVVSRFEQNFAAHLDVSSEHVLSTTCCTEGLFLAGTLFGFGEGDEVIAPAISFIAVGGAVMSYGATLRCCDVDPRTLNTTATDIERCITRKSKAVILNHYGGLPCEMDSIVALCREHKLLLIEDAACAVSSRYHGKACGTFGDLGVWSFDAMKILCTGDGAMIYAGTRELAERAKELLYLGLPVRQKSGTDSASGGDSRWWETQLSRIGRRAIMNNVSGAMGVAQLQKLSSFISRRRQIWRLYDEGLRQLTWLTTPPAVPVDCESSYYFYWIQTDRRDELARFLLGKEIYTTFRYWPLHKVDYFGLGGESLPNAESASQRTLNLPMHQGLTDEDVTKVVEALHDFGRRYC